MSRIRHHAIVVTSELEKHIKQAHERAHDIFKDTFAKVTPITGEAINSCRSFMVAPDGSKDGWLDSNRGDDAREEFVKFLIAAPLLIDWVEVEFGRGGPPVTRDPGEEG